MKVAIVCHGIYPLQLGGMEKHSYFLAKHLHQSGVDVNVLFPQVSASHSFPFPVHPLPWPKRPLWLWSHREFSSHAANWLQSNPPYIAFGQGFGLWRYLKKKTVPCVFHPHGLEMYGEGLRMKERLTALPFRSLVRFHARESDCTVSLGPALTSILVNRAHVPQENIREIPNAVVPTDWSFSEGAKKSNRILFVGRLAFNKGIDLLCRAMESFKNHDFEFTVVGDGPYRSNIEALAQRDRRVKYVGLRSDSELKVLYGTHDALLFSSRFEGMPTVILEAMASGCVVLATKIGAVPSMIDDSTGISFPPTVQGIGEGIKAFLELSTEKRLILRRSARARVESQFSWNVVVKQYLRLFEELIRKAGR